MMKQQSGKHGMTHSPGFQCRMEIQYTHLAHCSGNYHGYFAFFPDWNVPLFLWERESLVCGQKTQTSGACITNLALLGTSSNSWAVAFLLTKRVLLPWVFKSRLDAVTCGMEVMHSASLSLQWGDETKGEEDGRTGEGLFSEGMCRIDIFSTSKS